ncbi:MAG: hypothetical protein KDK50_06035 [Chlamydiia bacterium]|nr:hypothetical protein [Chlamydiia bacterium]
MRFFAWLISVILFILLLCVGASFYIYPRLPYYLSKNLSEKFQVPVHVNTIDVNKNMILLQGIDISNPKQSTLPTALKVAKTSVEAPLTNYLKKNIVIEQIQLDDIYASIEFYTKGNTEGNWTVLIDNFDSNNKFGSSQDKQPSGNVLIKKLIMTNINIDLKLYGKDVNRLSPIPRLEFENVGTEEGFPVEEITEIIIQKLIQQIFSLQGLSNMFKSVIQAPEKAATGILKGLFGG